MGVMFCLPGMYRNPILACDEDFFLEKLQWQQDFGLFIKYRELNFSPTKGKHPRRGSALHSGTGTSHAPTKCLALAECMVCNLR